MKPQLSLVIDDDPCQPWRQVTKFDRRATALADRHYSRQSPGSAQFMASGITFVLLAEFSQREAPTSFAVWGAIINLDPAGNRRFRCSIFRNETPWLSSWLIRAATQLSQARAWYRDAWRGSPPLTTEVNPLKTRRKRDPGRCFRRAAWRYVRTSRGLLVFEAPPFGQLEALFLLLLLNQRRTHVIELTKLNPAEKSRTYMFPGGEKIALSNVTHFLARESGTHRLQTADGKLHIVPTGWLHVEIEAEGFTV